MRNGVTASEWIHGNRDSGIRSFGSIVITIVFGKDVAEVENTVSYSRIRLTRIIVGTFRS